MATLPIPIPQSEIADFCHRNHIQKLSLFGSILTERFRPESDVDVLVVFEPQQSPTLLGMVKLERELGELLGRKVDLKTAGDLSRYFRDEVISMAAPQYECRRLKSRFWRRNAGTQVRHLTLAPE